MNPDSSDTTQLLLKWAQGDADALDALTPRVYQELRRIAGQFVKGEREGRTLQATALVHEVYLRLVDVRNVNWEGRAHFFAICAQLMRRILVDAARNRSAMKRGGGFEKLDLDDVAGLGETKDRELIALNDALEHLTGVDPRKAKLVELRYFGGLTVAETAAVMKLSEETITRDWRMAKAWLLTELRPG